MNLGPAIAALRHVGTYAAGIVTGLMLLGVKQDVAQQLVDSIVLMSKSLADILSALGIIIPLVIAWYSARSATSASRVKNISSMTEKDANAAVASLPASAKADIKLAIIPDHKLVAATAALPGVAKVEVKQTASDGVALAAADPLLPKVVVEKE